MFTIHLPNFPSTRGCGKQTCKDLVSCYISRITRKIKQLKRKSTWKTINKRNKSRIKKQDESQLFCYYFLALQDIHLKFNESESEKYQNIF